MSPPVIRQYHVAPLKGRPSGEDRSRTGPSLVSESIMSRLLRNSYPGICTGPRRTPAAQPYQLSRGGSDAALVILGHKLYCILGDVDCIPGRKRRRLSYTGALTEQQAGPRNKSNRRVPATRATGGCPQQEQQAGARNKSNRRVPATRATGGSPQ
jgi:hypothetical protein